MGDVIDFFKPANAGTTTYCEMLQAHDKHQWSPNGVDWFAVEFANTYDNGGSAEWWPRDKGREGDARMHLSYWGREKDGIHTGGCCSTSTLVGDTANPGWWGEPFTLSYGYGDLDVNATCDPVADMCNQAKRLVCLDSEYKCRYATSGATTTITTTPTPTLCPDGSAGLTKALYEAGNVAAYQDVTCIPDGEFGGYTKDIELAGLPLLKSIGEDAFRSVVGKLTFTGEYPALETIGTYAFGSADNAPGSSIALAGLQSLKSIERHAFDSFGGTLSLTGEYPALERIGYMAFSSAGNVNSVIRFAGLLSLKSIGESAGGPNVFNSFKGQLTVSGEYPNYEGCTRVGYGMNPDPDIVMHAPGQTPLTKAVYEEAAAKE
eukprot:gene22438-biopygen31389